jgi:hypothetical protein
MIYDVNSTQWENLIYTNAQDRKEDHIYINECIREEERERKKKHKI